MFNKFSFSKIGLMSAAILTFALLAACGGAPEESSVSLATAVPQYTVVEPQAEAAAPSTGAQNASSESELPQALADVAEGTVYTFTIDPEQTSVEYAVDEVLFGNSVITRGSTSDVAGKFTLSVQDGKPVVTLSDLQVDLRTLTSDNNFRDEMLKRQWLQSDTYPIATFVAKEVQGLPADAVQGQAYTFNVTGDMTIREITKPVTFQVTVTVDGAAISGEGTTQIYMRDFGFEPPEMLGRFTVSDPATITIKGVANLSAG